MRFIYCLCYAAGLGVVSFVLGRLVPKEWFDYTRFPYRSFAFEKGGKIYEAIGIAKWQSRVPDMSRIFPKLMPAKKIPARPDEQTLLVMIRETCAAEATHALRHSGGARTARHLAGRGRHPFISDLRHFRQSGFSHHSAL